jgi:hypothetical protein
MRGAATDLESGCHAVTAAVGPVWVPVPKFPISRNAENAALAGTLTCVQLLTLSDSATPDGLNPLNRSQELSASSKIAMPESNHHRFTILEKSGKM